MDLAPLSERLQAMQRRISRGLHVERERAVARLLGDSDYDQRRAYSVDSDPGDISAGKWCPYDLGGAEALAEWEED